MRGFFSHQLFAFVLCERGSRDAVFCQKSAEFRITQHIGREEDLADDVRRALERLFECVFAVNINFFVPLSMWFFHLWFILASEAS